MVRQGLEPRGNDEEGRIGTAGAGNAGARSGFLNCPKNVND